MLKKRVIAVAALIAVMMSAGVLTAQKRQVLLDRVVAVVGGSAILYSEVEDNAATLVQQRREQGYTSDRDPMNESLEMLMRQKLLYSQALIDSIDVYSDINSYVEEQLQSMIAEAGSIAELEAREHMPVFNFRELLRQQVVEQEYARSMQQTVVSDVKVSPGEVEQYFNSLKEEELPLVPEQYVYAQIVRYPSSQEDAKRRTRERLMEMRERIISGKSTMAVLARTYSVDPGTAMRGGEMPAGPLEELVAPYAEALEKLKPGQVSEVVETDYGFHIIELLEEPKNGLYRSRHILLRPTYTAEELNQPITFLDSLANMIRQDSITFEAAALEHSEDKLTKMNGGLVTNHDLLMSSPSYANVKYSATKFRREDFGDGKSLQDYSNIIRMKVGDVSPAYMAQDLRQNQQAKIIKLLEIIPTHPASLEEDYSTIEEMALSQKQQKIFDEWMREKIDGLYVYIAPDFREGEFEYPNWVK
ncbi:MAG: peptidylprolyl isomerase [Alistipes sp.]|jgi:peptidyl-prolyl cis-trans isomerase SurA|nr:peptidylprolyl isomerase [Alistipes sp.]MBQ5617586.1 peptidylprolyl isomerase [Alistipes sp.]MBQ5922101.1 peptidylprolyl isomerase [Alistipes sp.]